MTTKEQVQKNREKIRLKLENERKRKEEIRKKVEVKSETEKLEKEKEKKRLERTSDRSDLAVMISEKIKDVISSEFKDVIIGIEKLKIDTPEIPEIKVPEIVLPKIELPEITIPEIKLPTIVVPKIETPVIPEIEIPKIVLPEIPKVDTDKIIDAVIEGIKESFKDPLKVVSVDEKGRLNEGQYTPGGGAFKWLYNNDGETINPATSDNQTNGTQKTKITDGVDDVSICCDALVTTRSVHHRIKNSKEFIAGYCWVDVADTNSVYFLIKAGDKAPHGTIRIITSGKASLYFYETPTITADGTIVTPRCLNRETDATPVTTFFRDPTIGADGTELECALLGAAGHFIATGGETTGAYWWLDHNKNYIVKVTNTSGDVIDASVGYGFHEHIAV